MRSIRITVGDIIAKALGTRPEEVLGMLTTPPKPGMGDLSFPCFKIAKEKSMSPKDAAQQLCDKINSIIGPKDIVESARPEGPYANVYLNRSVAYDDYKRYFRYIHGRSFKRDRVNKTVVIDYSSPNIAKPIAFHHIRSTVIGNIIGNIFENAGYDVIRINYLGDWGTQFGKLITAFEKHGDFSHLEKEGIKHLLDIYVKYHNEESEESEAQARGWFKSMEGGDAKALDYWAKFKEISIKEFNRVYKRLGVQFTHTEGESFYNGKTDALIDMIQKSVGTSESEGALIIDMAKFDMPPVLLKKNDGATLYATRDIAAAMDRWKRFNFEESLYVVAHQQELHFKQLFKVLELMGCDWAKKCKHVSFGLLHLADTKMSTRSGNVIFLEDVLDMSVELAVKAIEEKNPDLGNKQEVAEAVGVGAIIFGDIIKRRNQDITFKWEDILNFDGETAPYVQYTHARAGSILRKADFMQDMGAGPSYSPNDAELDLIKAMCLYEDKIDEARKEHEPFIIARYALDLAKLFNRYYYQEKIIDVDDDSVRNEKLFIVFSVKEILKQSLAVLGVRAPERM